MDKVVQNIKKRVRDDINGMRPSEMPPEMEDSDAEHEAERPFTLEELTAEYNPDQYPDGTPVVGTEKMPHNIRGVLEYLATHQLKKPGENDGVTDDLVDDALLRMRVEGVSVEAIAKRLRLSREQVSARLSKILARQQSYMTNSEYRQLQINRLESIINMVWQYVSVGDPDQTKNLITVIERLNKMFELESEKSVIEINIVTDAQAKLIIGATLGVLEKVLALPQIAELKLEQRVIDGVVFDALTEAERVVQDAANNPLAIDKKQLAVDSAPQKK